MPNSEVQEGSPRSHPSRPPRLLPISDAAAGYRLVYGRFDALIRGRAEVAFEVALGFSTTMGDQFIRQAELPALRLTTPTIGSVQLGDSHTARGQVALDISDFEALRTFGGRRSIRQVLALPWQGDPTHLLPAFTHLLPAFSNDGIRPPDDDLLE